MGKRERKVNELPRSVKSIKRYKSSPQLTTRDEDDEEERGKRLENFRQLIMGEISTVKPRNLMQNLNRSLNDSIVDDQLVNAINENKANEILTDDDFNFEDFERMEAEAIEKLNQEQHRIQQECEELLLIESIIEWPDKPIASSTQLVSNTPVTIQPVLPVKNNPPPLANPPVIPKPPLFVKVPVKRPVWPAKPLPKNPQPTTSKNIQKSSIPDEVKMRIERNKQEALKRRQIFLDNQRKMRQKTGANGK